MNKKIKPEQLADTITASLKKWAEATEEAAAEGARNTAKELLPELQNAHPAGSGRYGSWDKYNSGWTSTLTVKKGKTRVSYVLHNQKEYRLTHLLEYGHALRQGGRAAAFPHIAPVAEMADDLLYENIMKIVNKN